MTILNNIEVQEAIQGAVLAEREACARVCDEIENDCPNFVWAADAAGLCATKIRSRTTEGQSDGTG